MIKRTAVLFSFAAVLMLTAGTLDAKPARFGIDMSHSKVGFAIDHLVINKTFGAFKTVDSTLLFDKDAPETLKVDVSIDVASVDTDNEKRDKHLLAADFFDAAKFPKITFKSNKVWKKDGEYFVRGTLTMHGVSKEINIPFKVKGPITDPWGMIRLGIEGKVTLNRKDFGVNGGGAMVGDTVDVFLNLEFVSKKK